MEVIKSMRNLFSSKYKEDDNKYKKKIFVGLVFTCVIMLTENGVQRTFFDLSESFNFQFLASYLYHCVFMI